MRFLLLFLALTFFTSCEKIYIKPPHKTDPNHIPIAIKGSHLVGKYTLTESSSNLQVVEQELSVKYEDSNFRIFYKGIPYDFIYDANSNSLYLQKDKACTSDRIQQIRFFEQSENSYGLYITHYNANVCNGSVYASTATYKKIQ
ncbi:hypothetical protein Q0590_07055 [Rhodocytophaga aerolata]|uniref:Lipoprotein n=1 Tax=Rhodocytophaga aerolata TaxID=455078 RepID=A0ABT8R3N5_9BACT|nr:hypothetical protein [Rhodocytophaga aerolata]MDO1446004.1 hypothetical protein [Rhodocytophaga aerolata]